MTPDQQARARAAYEANLQRFPALADGTPRAPWDQLGELAKLCWLDPMPQADGQLSLF